MRQSTWGPRNDSALGALSILTMDQLSLWIENLVVLDGTLLTATLIVALLFATAGLVAIGVPGVIVPATFAAEALAGPVAAAAAVSMGALAGSQLLFLATRRWGRRDSHSRFGTRLESFERRFAEHGIWYVVGLRIIGTPHVLVTVGSAMMPIRAPAFAFATLLGSLPAIVLAAAAGSII
jgi:uncharacterized membrane protein YdjX (TVP38/TMEM64 family)